MRLLAILLCCIALQACGGSDGGSSDGDGGGGFTADYYWRSGVHTGTFSLSGPPNGHNPVIDANTGNPYRVNEVVRVDGMLNGVVSSNILSTINNGHLTAVIMLPPYGSQLIPLSEVFEGQCSVPNVNVSAVTFETRDNSLDIVKIGWNGNVDIAYMYVYADGNASVNCTYEDSDGETNDVRVSLYTGWNEIKISEADITSINATDQYWVINF